MSHVIFSNPGLVDLRALRTFGMNAKAKDNPLGFFGTGFKHALAVLLRAQQQVILWRGLDRYTFRTETVDSRGQSFEVVYMDGPEGTIEMPFTLQLGKTWQMWMAYRELHSNALDESGTTTFGTPKPREGYTTIAIRGSEIEEAYNRRHTIFLDSVPVYEHPDIEIYLGESTCAYYRGVRILDLPKPSLYTYNLKTTLGGITEDRTLKNESDLAWYICRFLETCEDKTFLTDLMLAPDTCYEHDLVGYASRGTDVFVNTYAKLRQEGHATQLAYWANTLYLRLKKVYPLPPPIQLSPIQQKQLAKAVDFCRRAGWDVDSYPIITVPSAHGGLLALAENGQIVLTERLYDLGVKALVSSLLEEWTHLRYQLRDETRAMQTHLFDKLVGAKEEVLEEPL